MMTVFLYIDCHWFRLEFILKDAGFSQMMIFFFFFLVGICIVFLQHVCKFPSVRLFLFWYENSMDHLDTNFFISHKSFYAVLLILIASATIQTLSQQSSSTILYKNFKFFVFEVGGCPECHHLPLSTFFTESFVPLKPGRETCLLSLST